MFKYSVRICAAHVRGRVGICSLISASFVLSVQLLSACVFLSCTPEASDRCHSRKHFLGLLSPEEHPEHMRGWVVLFGSVRISKASHLILLKCF